MLTVHETPTVALCTLHQLRCVQAVSRRTIQGAHQQNVRYLRLNRCDRHLPPVQAARLRSTDNIHCDSEQFVSASIAPSLQ
ncbi:hypothetical protein ROP_54330 [Rhodococcus opacus B4]|uniref:Uncharacterized protein n=1 Tax=Rhodococcus opacus (strain B4) TaxID=632772 RepID=C1AWA7_RHOOB|nr:hypothetical protein ROP_54330 [Rhodococcus opacus B4]